MSTALHAILFVCEIHNQKHLLYTKLKKDTNKIVRMCNHVTEIFEEKTGKGIK